jgi:hypothetical protein
MVGVLYRECGVGKQNLKVLYSLSEFLCITHEIVGKWKVFLVIYFSEVLCCICFV